jgi:outer membrane protein assembly factor BamB
MPAKWDAAKSIGIAWKTPIPGLAHSSPVVWGDRIFLTTAVKSDSEATFQTNSDDNDPVNENTQYSWRVYCLDKGSGRVLWERTAHEGAPRVKRHIKASQSNSTPTTDGRYVVAIFASEGMYCYDFDGRLVWKADLGLLDPGLHEDAAVQWGYASSPAIYKDLVIVQADCHAQSFVAAYDIKTGKQVWRDDRKEMPSWSSPLIYQGKTRAELITNAPRFVRAYDPATGRELWRFANSDLIVQVPAPFVAHDLFYVTGGWPGGRPIKVFRPGASGNVSSAQNGLAWHSERGGPYVPTPIVYGDYLYVCTDKGVLSCYNARTGEQVYQRRINDQGAGFSASPVAADGKLYFASEDGDVYVLRAGREYELMAINPMGEALMATPAISDGLLIIRGQRHLFAVSNRARK